MSFSIPPGSPSLSGSPDSDSLDNESRKRDLRSDKKESKSKRAKEIFGTVSRLSKDTIGEMRELWDQGFYVPEISAKMQIPASRCEYYITSYINVKKGEWNHSDKVLLRQLYDSCVRKDRARDWKRIAKILQRSPIDCKKMLKLLKAEQAEEEREISLNLASKFSKSSPINVTRIVDIAERSKLMSSQTPPTSFLGTEDSVEVTEYVAPAYKPKNVFPYTTEDEDREQLGEEILELCRKGRRFHADLQY